MNISDAKSRRGRLSAACASVVLWMLLTIPLLMVVDSEDAMAAPAISANPAFQVLKGVNVFPFLWKPTVMTKAGFTGAGYRRVEQYFPRHEFERMRDMGFDYIRLPLNVGPLALASAAERRVRADYILDQVDAISAIGLKVIVDIHTPDKEGNSPFGAQALIDGPRMFETLKDIVDVLAERVAKRPADRVALELLNEPQVECRTPGLWESYLAQLVRVARNRAPNHTLVVTGSCGGGLVGLLHLDPTTFMDSNMLFSVHYYSPPEFIFQGYQVQEGDPFSRYRPRYHWPATPEGRSESLDAFTASVEDLWTSPSAWMYVIRQYRKIRGYYAAAFDTHSISQDFADMRSWADRYGIAHDRLFLGEFGAPRQEPTLFPSYERERLVWTSAVRKEAEKSGMPWAYWCYGSYFGIVYNDKPSRPGNGWKVDAPLVDALSLVQPVTLQ